MIRHAALYALLVGLSIVVEVGLLRLGRGLQTVPDVRGEWRGAGVVLFIKQSGPDVWITLADGRKLTGTIARNELRAASVVARVDERAMRGDLQRADGRIIAFTATKAFTANRERR